MDYDWLGESSLGFYRIWVIHLGRRYAILGALAQSMEPLAPDDLAAKTGLDPGAVNLWCEAAFSLGVIRRKGGRCGLPGRMKELVVDEMHPDYIGGQFSYLALRSLDYDAFDGFFRKGARPKETPHLVEAFMEATRWDHTAFLKVLLPKSPGVKATLLRKSKVLDVGSGTGEWTFRISRAFPLPEYTGIESDPTALRKAEERAHREGAPSIKFVRGNAEDITSSSEFDLVYLGEVLCVMGRRDRALQRCFEAMKPGGYLVVGEGLIGKRASTDPTDGLMRGMELDFALLGASFLSRKELARLLREAGFRELCFLPAGGGFWFVVSRRPKAGSKFDRTGMALSKQ